MLDNALYYRLVLGLDELVVEFRYQMAWYVGDTPAVRERQEPIAFVKRRVHFRQLFRRPAARPRRRKKPLDPIFHKPFPAFE